MNRDSSTSIFPKRIPRLNYLARFLIFLVFLIFTMLTLEFLVWQRVETVNPILFLSILGLLVIVRFPFMDIPRARSAGFSPWFLLLALIPGVGIILQILLFALPPKNSENKASDQIASSEAAHDLSS